MANKSKNQMNQTQSKAAKANDQEIAKELTALEKDQEYASEFQYKPSKNANQKSQQNPNQ